MQMGWTVSRVSGSIAMAPRALSHVVPLAARMKR
jgi:hypothetical protein